MTLHHVLLTRVPYMFIVELYSVFEHIPKPYISATAY